jgi:hypothetical protein
LEIEFKYLIIKIMEVALAGVFVPILISLGAFVMIVFLRKYENTERLKMIEHGMDPQAGHQKRRGAGLKIALVAIGVGIGLLVGNVLDAAGIVDEEVAYFSMIFLFGGVGLLIGYLIEVKQIKAEQEQRS